MFPSRFTLSLTCLMAAAPVLAQPPTQPVENVHWDYAQVLDVQPVYENGGASVADRAACEARAAEGQAAREAQAAPRRDRGAGMFSAWSTVRGWFGHAHVDATTAQPATLAATAPADCQPVVMAQPVAYDVDYIYKGTKYRSRMAEDPGKRLRVKVSVSPQPFHAPADK